MTRPRGTRAGRSSARAIDARFVASRELFIRCRGRVSTDDVKRYAPNDPGYPGYVAAFESLLKHGECELKPEFDFDVTETISLTRWSHARAVADPARFRWFRLLTCAVEILLDQAEAPHYVLASLLVDAFALELGGDDLAPTDLLSAVCGEVDASPRRAVRAKEHVFCVLGRLLLARSDGLDDAAVEALCTELEERDRRYHEWWKFEGAHWTDQPKSDELVWSLTVYDQLHPVWIDLVEAHFPVAPPSAASMKQRLLADGARWKMKRRALS